MLARRIGGDGQLAAGVIALITVASAPVLPARIALVR